MNLIMPNYYSSMSSQTEEALYGGIDVGINTYENDSAPEGLVPWSRSEAIFVTVYSRVFVFFLPTV